VHLQSNRRHLSTKFPVRLVITTPQCNKQNAILGICRIVLTGNGSSQVPGMVHAGYAAKRMCLREFNQAMNNMPTGKFPPGKGPVRGGGLNLSQVRPTISCGCPHILFAVFLGGQGAVRMSAFRASRYTCSAHTHVRKIQVSAKSPAGLAGPSQHLRQPAVVVDGTFFVHATHNCGYYNKGQAPMFGSCPDCLRNGVPIGDEFFCPRHANVEHNSSSNSARHGAGNVGADGTPEPPFSRVHFSTKSPRLAMPSLLHTSLHVSTQF
jgi:hypothetical protein